MHAQGDKKKKYVNHKIETILQQVSINSSKSNVKQNSDNDSPHDVLVYPSVIYQIKILFHRINQPIQLNKMRWVILILWGVVYPIDNRQSKKKKKSFTKIDLHSGKKYGFIQYSRQQQ